MQLSRQRDGHCFGTEQCERNATSRVDRLLPIQTRTFGWTRHGETRRGREVPWCPGTMSVAWRDDPALDFAPGRDPPHSRCFEDRSAVGSRYSGSTGSESCCAGPLPDLADGREHRSTSGFRKRAMCASPKSRVASSWLCARHSNAMPSIECWRDPAQGSRWWNSRNSRASQRRPEGDVQAQRPPSRSATRRRIAAGMWREGRSPLGFAGRGLSVSPSCRLRSRSSSSAMAFAMIFPTSPSGIWCRIRALSSSSCAWRSGPAVKRTA